MDRWRSMRVFVEVAAAGGFAEAARKLNMSPPAVTRAVAELEDLVATRLLVRTTRVVKLTDSGQRFFDDCRRLLTDLAQAEAGAAGLDAAPTGLLSVTASALFGKMYVLPILTDYLDLHEGVTGRTLFVDQAVSIVDEAIDVAVRIGRLSDSALTAIKVGSVEQVVCGAPAYFERRGVPRSPAELADHQVIAATRAGALSEWRFGGGRQTRVSIQPRLICNTNEAAIAAAVDGWGLTRLPSYQIGPELLAGRLQTVRLGCDEERLPIHVIHLEGRRASAKVRSFVDFAVDRLRAERLFN